MDVMHRLEANSIPEPNTGCHIWLGALVRDHGVMKVDGRQYQAHRLAWEQRHGAIPGGKWVLHECGVSACVNVDHLRLGNAMQNGFDLSRHYAKHGRPARVLSGPSDTRVRADRVEMDADEVRRVLDYDPETGVLRWKHRPDRERAWNTKHAGKVAGSVLPIGYRYVMVLGKLHIAHRLIFLWMTGEWPVGQVDHINRVRSDNRWANLRAATQMQNSANQGLRRTNKSGVAGVSWDDARGKWFVKIRVGYKQIALGRFDKFEDAVAARRAAEALHHGDFANREPA